MFDINPLTPDDQKFLHDLAGHMRKHTPAKNKDGVEVLVFPIGDCDKIADRLEAIAQNGDSTAEISRVVVG